VDSVQAAAKAGILVFSLLLGDSAAFIASLIQFEFALAQAIQKN
jgi:hypothetical protein